MAIDCIIIWYNIPSIDIIKKYKVINQNNSSKHVHIAINNCFVYKTTVMNNICPSNHSCRKAYPYQPGCMQNRNENMHFLC